MTYDRCEKVFDTSDIDTDMGDMGSPSKFRVERDTEELGMRTVHNCIIGYVNSRITVRSSGTTEIN